MADARLNLIFAAKDLASNAVNKLNGQLSGFTKAGIAAGVASAVTSTAMSAVGGAAYKVGELIGGSIEKASALNETMSKSSVIFGASAAKMEKFGNTAAVSLGLSKQAAIEAGASMGNFFTGIGQTQDKAEKMSESLVGLAGDLASFNNLDPTEVLQKLRSGLTGEAEPLRSVGVFLTEAKVKAKAMQMGLADAHGELSEGAKVMARYNIILDETKTAQGDFARTADGLANSQRTVNAELEDAQAKLGQKLLPIWTEANKVLLRMLDSSTLSAKQMQYAAEHGSQAAAAALRNLKPAAKETAGSFETLAGKAQDDLIGPTSVASAAIDMRDAVEKSMAAATKAAQDNETKTTAALKGVIANAYEPLIAAAEIAATQREIAEQDQIISSQDSTAAQIADARDRKLQLQQTLAEQLVDQAQYGSVAQRAAYLNAQLQSQQLIAGLASEDPQVKAQAQATVKAIEDELRGLQSRANGYGFATGSAYTRGLTDSLDSGVTSVTGAFKQYTGLFYASSPPGPDSPLHFIDKWGERTGEAWAESFATGMGGGSSAAALGAIAAGLSPAGSVGESAFGLAGGSRGGYVLPSAGRSSASTPVEIPIYLDGREVARVVDRHLHYGMAGAFSTTRS